MRFKRTVVAAAVVGLLVGVPTAGAAGKHLITGSDVKDGTVMQKDLSEGVQNKINRLGATVVSPNVRGGGAAIAGP
jgi:hypothetical protein